MGNRAVITDKKNWEQGGVGIYLHWSGGRDSVEAFLEYCKLRGFRAGDYGKAIDRAQPEADRMPDGFFDAEVVKAEDLKPGDWVFIQNWNNEIDEVQVVGYGEDRTINGTNVSGLPVVGMYLDKHGKVKEDNINNYLREAEYRADRF